MEVIKEVIKDKMLIGCNTNCDKQLQFYKQINQYFCHK